MTWADGTQEPSTRIHQPEFAQPPFTALLILYSTTTGFPCSTTKRPAPMKTPVSRSLSFSSPVSNFISMTSSGDHAIRSELETGEQA